ncbi:Alpha/Beta hydrolase protein [Halteromyces radiatus]|uniref:Alpha/Beta hydrolase protein n=1 Tax=Halteromyces radiatus TaxID=101107 RepID=UPI00221ECFFF|nr:Alpha/Beta hydrolase protein [Halteromyces radiatus]KAI8078910.1 Alpha/Beta hydrolase protein [Halteromyces radiatus]
MQHIHVKSSKSKNYRKPIPKASKSRLVFKYSSSPDGVDTNLLVLLHGLGDTLQPFATLGQKLQLPQTAILAVQAPELIPYMDCESYQWYPSFDMLTGEVLSPDDPRQKSGLLKTRQLLTVLLKHLIEDCQYPASQIFFFGFSQGGTVALDQVLEGDIRNLGGVISISGYPFITTNDLKNTLYDGPILITQGDKDPVIGTRSQAEKMFNGIKQRCASTAQIKQLFISGKGHHMPTTEQEWRSIHSFFASYMPRRNLELENMADVYEINTTSGSA